MTTHEVWLTKLFNEYLAGLGNWLLALFKLTAADPKEPWADFIVMQIVVAAIMIVLFLVLRSRLSVDKPGKLQHLFELIHGFVVETAEDQVGHDAHHHVVLFETLFIFLLLANLIGMIPGFISPTQVVYVPAGCAVLAFLYYNYVGLKKNGPLKYGKHFLGPIPVMAPLMIPIEIISHFARPLYRSRSVSSPICTAGEARHTRVSEPDLSHRARLIHGTPRFRLAAAGLYLRSA